MFSLESVSLRIADYDFILICVDQKPLNGDGEPRDIVTDHQRGTIELYHNVRGPRRRLLVREELFDLYRYYTKDEDEQRFTDWLLDQWKHHDGLAAVDDLVSESEAARASREVAFVAEELERDRSADSRDLMLNADAEAAERAALDQADPQRVRHVSGDAAKCIVCGAVFVGTYRNQGDDGEILTSSPYFDPAHRVWVVRRELYCPDDGCKHVQQWLQEVDAEGRPIGSLPVDRPKLFKRSDQESFVKAFLRRYPQLADRPMHYMS